MNPSRTGRPPWPIVLAALVLFASTAGCGAERQPRPSRLGGPAVWVAPAEARLDGGSARLLADAGVEEVFLEAGSFTWDGERPLVEETLSGAERAVPEGTAVTLALRGPAPAGEGTDPEAAGHALAGDLRAVALVAEAQGLLPLGVHLEMADGAPTAPEILRAVRTAIGPGLLLSTSIPRQALGTEGAAATARAVDYVVVFLYGQPAAAADDPSAWDPERVHDDLAALEALETDYLVGFHVVGGARHLSSSGESIEAPAGSGGLRTRTDLKSLALDPALRLNVDDAFAGVGRLVHTFQAQAPSRSPGWPVAPGESVRVVQTAPALVRSVVEELRHGDLEHYTGPLFHRTAAPEELLALEPSGIAAALGKGPLRPDLRWRVVVKSRARGSYVLTIELENRGRQATDLGSTDGNYLEVRALDGHFVAIEPGDFSRYSLWKGDREARPGIGWREPDGLRLNTPLVHGGERIGGASLTLRTRGQKPRIAVAGRFLLTEGGEMELPVVEGEVDPSLAGPSSEAAGSRH